VRSRSIERAPARVGSGRRTHRSLDRVLGLGKVPHVSRHGGDDAVVVVVVDVDVASHRGGVDGGAPALNLAAPGGVVSEILIDGLYRSMRSRVGFFPASMVDIRKILSSIQFHLYSIQLSFESIQRNSRFK